MEIFELAICGLNKLSLVTLLALKLDNIPFCPAFLRHVLILLFGPFFGNSLLLFLFLL